MRCQECKKSLSQFLEHQLDARQEEIMRKHIEQCADCSRALASFTEMVNLLHGLREVNPPPDFIRKVNARLDAPTLWQQWQQRVALLWRAPLALRAATVAATLVLAIYVTNQSRTFETKGTIAPAGKSMLAASRMKETRDSEPALTPQWSAHQPETSPTRNMPVQVPMTADSLMMPAEEAGQSSETGQAMERVSKSKARVSSQSFAKGSSAEMVLPEAEQAVGRVELKSDTIEKEAAAIEPGNLIAAYREQEWLLIPRDPKQAEPAIAALLTELKAFDIQPQQIADDSSVVYRFSIHFSQVSLLAARCERLGAITYITPFPIARPEDYTSTHGGGNSLLPEEVIPVQLTLKKPRP
jgi:hypothetical protein